MPPLSILALLDIAFLTISAFAASGSGQTATTTAQQPMRAVGNVNSVPTQESTVMRTNANLVLVDVVVTDKDKAVLGLDRQRFHIFEDGHEQVITSFDERSPSEARGSRPQPPMFQGALPPHTYSNVPGYPEASAVNVLLLDGLNTPMANQMDVHRQMLLYLGKIEPGTPLAIFTLASRLRMVAGFTRDAAELTKVLKSPKFGPQQSVILDPQTDVDLDKSISDIVAMGANSDAVGAMQQLQADMTAFQTDQRIRMTLDAMQELARYLSAIPGRKNLIWFSGSFPLALDPDDSLQSPFEAMRNYSNELRETSELLSAARVAVYPVDARGLLTPLPFDASKNTASSNLVTGTVNAGRRGNRQSITANKPNLGKDDAAFTKQLMQEQASMEQIAQETGGKEFINTNGLKEAVASAVANGSSYYTIGYVPVAKMLDGNFHKLKVRVDGGTYKLAYRSGYYADPPDGPIAPSPGTTSLITTATLRGAPPATQILFQARLLPATDPLLQGARLPDSPLGEMAATLKQPTHRVIIDLKVDPNGLALETTAAGVRSTKAEFVLVAYDADGKRINYLDRGFQLNLSTDQYARSLENGIPVRMALDLPSGPISLRIAVHDLTAGRPGSLEIPLK